MSANRPRRIFITHPATNFRLPSAKTLSEGGKSSATLWLADSHSSCGGSVVQSSPRVTERVWAYGSPGNGTTYPLYPRKRTLIGGSRMSAKCQWRTFTARAVSVGALASAFKRSMSWPSKRRFQHPLFYAKLLGTLMLGGK
jgi:hypothetical protein